MGEMLLRISASIGLLFIATICLTLYFFINKPSRKISQLNGGTAALCLAFSTLSTVFDYPDIVKLLSGMSKILLVFFITGIMWQIVNWINRTFIRNK